MLCGRLGVSRKYCDGNISGNFLREKNLMEILTEILHQVISQSFLSPDPPD